MTKYTVWSKHPSASDWQVERSYMLRPYADEVADAIKKAGKMVKITRK